MSEKTLKDLDPERLRNARVLVRADLNVPLDGGRVTDDTRIRATLPTLETLLDAGARVILFSHLGRPKGRPDPGLSLRPVAARLSELLGRDVRFVEDFVGDDARAAVEALEPGGVLLLENTRFHPGETEGDPELAAALADLGDLFVNDAFGSAHRDHASTGGVARAVRARGGEAVAGHLLEKELDFLGRTLHEPRRPFVAILGGAKISGKIDVIESLLPRVDRLLVGGAMANTFLKALGYETGDSLVEDDRVEMAAEVVEKAGERLVLPVDCVVADAIEEGVATRTVPRDSVSEADRIGDIGVRSREVFAGEIAGAGTIVWNGPMGVFELEAFRAGTLAVARAVADATDEGALSVVGGGDSAAAAEVAGVSERLSHVSTGGGASLEFLAGAELPGVAALSEK
ncbi:MAG: phosphoglycerate kinase [Gemmatimonadota bacterium]|jgi:phosphoglycerate kinase